MKILSWNCGGGFFTKGKWKLIEKYNADILIIQECSDPDKSTDENFLKLYPHRLWLPDYEQKEVLIEGHTVGHQEGVAVFAQEVSLQKLSWENESDEEITWWQKTKKPPIIKNKKLRGFNPVHIESLGLLLLGIHAKTGIKPSKYDGMKQIQVYLEMNRYKLDEYRKVIIAGDFNAGFKESDKEKYDELIKIYYERYSLKDCVQNYSEKFIPTHHGGRDGIGYIDDFILLSKFFNLNIIPTDGWKANKKGKKRWGYVDEENKGSDHCPVIVEIEI